MHIFAESLPAWCRGVSSHPTRRNLGRSRNLLFLGALQKVGMSLFTYDGCIESYI